LTHFLSPCIIFCFSLLLRALRSTLFPYTTLFRSTPAPAVRKHARPQLLHRRDDLAAPLLPALLHRTRKPPRDRLDGEEVAGEHRSEEHTSELQSRGHLVCRLLLEKKKYN